MKRLRLCVPGLDRETVCRYAPGNLCILWASLWVVSLVALAMPMVAWA